MDELLTDMTAFPAATAGDYAGREDFDENLLGQHMPLPALAGSDTVLLPYTHFSVLLRLDKRLAAVTGVGIDEEKLMDLDRAGISWRLDPRLSADQQSLAHDGANMLLDRALVTCGRQSHVLNFVANWKNLQFREGPLFRCQTSYPRICRDMNKEIKQVG